MSKYCGNCGAQMDDSARVCGNCGTPFVGATPASGAARTQFRSPAAKAKNKKILTIAGGAAAALVVLIIVIKILTTFTGYNGAVRKAMKAYEKYDIDTLASMSSDYLYMNNADDVDDYFKSILNSDYDRFDDYVGHNYKLSYEVKETYKMPEYELSEYRNYADYNDYDIGDLSTIKVSDISVTAKGSGSETITIRLALIKEGRSWKIFWLES